MVFFTAERTGLSTQLGPLKVVNKHIYLQSRNDCLCVSPYVCLQISFLGCVPPCKLSTMDKHYLQRNKRKLIRKTKKSCHCSHCPGDEILKSLADPGFSKSQTPHPSLRPVSQNESCVALERPDESKCFREGAAGRGKWLHRLCLVCFAKSLQYPSDLEEI